MDPFELNDELEQAGEAIRQRNPVRALAILDQLLAARFNHPLLFLLRSRALVDCGQHDEAVAEARRAVELAPEAGETHYVLGQAAWQAKRLTLAQQSLERAIELSGRQPRFLVEYAQFMASERGPRLAERAAREAVDADGSSSTAWAALGLAEYKLRRYADAEKSVDRALELDPNDAFAQSIKVLMLRDKGKDAQAAALAEILSDSPGTEEFVEAVRKDLNQRRAMQRLLERDEVQNHLARRRDPLWLRWGGPVLIVAASGIGAFIATSSALAALAVVLVVALLVFGLNRWRI